ncbi:MAG: hypothetical protein VB078_00785 [Clostridiaceae bacterium]|nr:hypothetical protein [Clostridiaceae bacterium]
MEKTLENLTQYIKDEATLEAQKLLQDALSEAEKARSDAQGKIDAMLARQKEQISSQSEQRIKDAVRQKTVNLLKERTQYAAELIDTLFDEAEDELCNMSAKDFLRFFNSAIASSDINGACRIILGERTACVLSTEQRVMLELSTDRYKLTVENSTVPNQGGFVLEQPPVEYSFLFSDLLNEIKRHESPSLLKRLID